MAARREEGQEGRGGRARRECVGLIGAAITRPRVKPGPRTTRATITLCTISACRTRPDRGGPGRCLPQNRVRSVCRRRRCLLSLPLLPPPHHPSPLAPRFHLRPSRKLRRDRTRIRWTRPVRFNAGAPADKLVI
jgi:hypothetical protein